MPFWLRLRLFEKKSRRGAPVRAVGARALLCIGAVTFVWGPPNPMGFPAPTVEYNSPPMRETLELCPFLVQDSEPISFSLFQFTTKQRGARSRNYYAWYPSDTSLYCIESELLQISMIVCFVSIPCNEYCQYLSIARS